MYVTAHGQTDFGAMTARTLAVTAGVLLALSCNPHHGRLPAASCRSDRDCPATLACRHGTCTAGGWVQGVVRNMDPSGSPEGPLTIAVYRESDLGPDGPRAGVAPTAGPTTIASPEYPQPYRLDGLPKGAQVVVATVAAPGSPSGKPLTHGGMARFISFGGTPFTRITGDVSSGKVDVPLSPFPRPSAARSGPLPLGR